MDNNQKVGDMMLRVRTITYIETITEVLDTFNLDIVPFAGGLQDAEIKLPDIGIFDTLTGEFIFLLFNKELDGPEAYQFSMKELRNEDIDNDEENAVFAAARRDERRNAIMSLVITAGTNNITFRMLPIQVAEDGLCYYPVFYAKDIETTYLYVPVKGSEEIIDISSLVIADEHNVEWDEQQADKIDIFLEKVLLPKAKVLGKQNAILVFTKEELDMKFNEENAFVELRGPSNESMPLRMNSKLN